MTSVIEALLCAAADANNVSLNDAVNSTWCDPGAAFDAVHASYRRRQPLMRYGDRLAETAYHLIESDPVLRREWFGA